MDPSNWDLQSGKELRTFEGDYGVVHSIITTPDGKYVVLGSYNNTIKLWDLQSGKMLRTFKGHGSWISSAAVTADGKYIVSGSVDGYIELWDLKGGELQMTYSAFNDTGWIAWNEHGEYNCSKNAKKYISFLDDSKGTPMLVERNNPIYEQRKKKLLFSFK